jgi:hypothetical protein
MKITPAVVTGCVSVSFTVFYITVGTVDLGCFSINLPNNIDAMTKIPIQ